MVSSVIAGSGGRGDGGGAAEEAEAEAAEGEAGEAHDKEAEAEATAPLTLLLVMEAMASSMSRKAVLMRREEGGRVQRALQSGQEGCSPPPRGARSHPLMQSMSKLWPHTSVVGVVRVLRQIEHVAIA
jgi:hypothetical protein